VNAKPQDVHDPPLEVIVFPGRVGLGAVSTGLASFVI
jgi:hypothetical protein